MAFLRHLLLLGVMALMVVVATSTVPERAKDLLKEAGFSTKEIGQVLKGELIKTVVVSSNQREISMAFAVLLKESPQDLEDNFISLKLKKRVDPGVTALGLIPDPASIKDFGNLCLEEKNGGDALVKKLVQSAPGFDLNLSKQEMSVFHIAANQTKGKQREQVEKGLREMLLNRYNSYKQKGLAGVLPYARPGDKDYKAGDDLLMSSKMAKMMQRETPSFHKHLITFPANRPNGLEESFHWTNFDVDGIPDVSLSHRMGHQENGVFVFSERQYYVLSGFNSVQGIGGAMASEDGTLLLMSSRTSTDAVTGFGATAKRKIGERMMGSLALKLLERLQEVEDEL